ncbi:caib baif family enzyme [Ophiostoma piceae UAMH 11346]|uniref:Caib baif family enzyme n=1 Tax=Ophiostoma piceae (strain UAMH 11346) TaxID=1262450 RepID=S3CSA7_OPHP1|nr:caib baif family enzyme [Ophiostoma piceae UAMH 11346]
MTRTQCERTLFTDIPHFHVHTHLPHLTMTTQLDLFTVEKAPSHVALQVLKALCKDDPKICEKAAALIDLAMKVSATGADLSLTRKRLAEDKKLKFCERCETVYGPNEAMGPGVCVAHEGELTVDWDGDVWADHDENCHGPIDTEEHRIEYPEGFLWDCCEEVNGDTPGCSKLDWHEHVLSDSSSVSSVEDNSEKDESDGSEQSPVRKRVKVEAEVITIDD